MGDSMKSKCIKCEQWFREQDGQEQGLFIFICNNCHMKYQHKPVKPLEPKLKKWFKGLFLAFFLLILLVPNSLADTYADNVTMYPPSSYELNISYNNHTEIYPFFCLLNSTIETARCDIERTMVHGETYARDDDLCKLNIKCPNAQTCTSDDNNVSYKVSWRIFTNESSGRVYIINENTNESREYPYSEGFDFTDEFDVTCPSLEEYEDELRAKIEGWMPVNMTHDEWYYVCGRSLESTTKAYAEASGSLTKFQEKMVVELGTLQVSNNALSTENGLLKTKAAEYDTCTNMKNELEYKIQDLQDEKQKCYEEREKMRSESNGKNLAIWILGVSLVAIIIFLIGKIIMNDEDLKREL